MINGSCYSMQRIIMLKRRQRDNFKFNSIGELHMEDLKIELHNLGICRILCKKPFRNY